MAVAAMARGHRAQRTATARRAQPECKGRFEAQEQVEGQWVTLTEDTYKDEGYRLNALAEHVRWVNNAPAGSVRRVVEHCTVDGKPRHIIRAENQPRGVVEPWSEVDCALCAGGRQVWAS